MKRIKHQIRQAYGFTDEQIYTHIAEQGEEWAYDSYRFIMEDQNVHWQTMMSVMPLARTPQDKKSGKSIVRYSKELRKALEKTFAPWIEQRRIAAIKKRLSEPPKSITLDESGNEIDFDDPDWWKKL